MATISRRVSVYLDGGEAAQGIRNLVKERAQLKRAIESGTLSEKEYIAAFKRLDEINPVINEHRKRLNGVESAWAKLGKGAGQLAAVTGVAFGVDAVVDYAKELFRTGTEMEVLSKKAATVFGEALPLVSEQAQKNAADMGLTTSAYVNQAAAIGDLLIPMGFQREEAANISTNLVDLSGALSEWTGGQIKASDVSRILSKSMLGEREELKQLGISIQEADVKERLRQKGLEKLTGTMLQQAKAAATLELITEKSVDAQTAYAENSDTLVRKQANISAKISDISEKIAVALIPVFDRLLDAVLPVVDAIVDATNAMTTGEEATTEFGRGIQFLLGILEKLWEMQTGVYRGISSFVLFLLDKAAPVFEFVTEKLAAFYNMNVRMLNLLDNLPGIDVDIKEIDTDKLSKGLDRAREIIRAARQDPEINAPIGPEIPDYLQEQRGNQSGAASPQGDTPELDKAAARELAALERKQQALLAVIEKYKEAERLATLNAEDRKIAELAIKYDEHIAIAAELEEQGVKDAAAQRLELERLKQEAIDALRTQMLHESFEAEQSLLDEQMHAEIEAELERMRQFEEAKQTIKQELDEVRLEEDALERLRIEEQFNELLALAWQHGLDTVEIEEAKNQKLAEANRRFREKELSEEAALVDAHRDLQLAKVQAFAAASALLRDIVGQNQTLATGLFLFEKTLAAAEVIIQLQKEVAAINATYAAFGPAGTALAALATSRARIRAGISLATIASTAVQGVVAQRKDGGYATAEPPAFRWTKGGIVSATGADDGRTYRARTIAEPQTGMLDFPGPVLFPSASGVPVLANERGREFLVSNESLRNPVIADYVRMIDNIQQGPYRQRATGGFTTPTPAASDLAASAQATNLQPTLDPATIGELTAMMQQLDGTLRSGIVALIPDETVVEIYKKQNQLSRASGGTLGS